VKFDTLFVTAPHGIFQTV